MWSCSGTPSICPAAINWFVVVISCLLGFGSPEGWLCAIITDAALSVSGPAKTSRGWANDAVSVPIVTTRHVISLCALLTERHIKYSCRLSRKWARHAKMSFISRNDLPSATLIGCSQTGHRFLHGFLPSLIIDHHQTLRWHPTRQHISFVFFNTLNHIKCLAYWRS